LPDVGATGELELKIALLSGCSGEAGGGRHGFRGSSDIFPEESKMRAKKGPFVVTLVAAGLLLSGLSTAFADVSYTYTGNYFTQFKNTSREPQLFSPADSLSFSFTVADYLETGGVLQDLDSGSVSFWQMSAGSVTFGSTHGDVIDNVAVAATRTSVPSSWWFSGISGADFVSSFTSFGGPLSPGDPSDQVVIVYPYFEEGSDATYAVNGANVFASGTWTVSSDSVPVPVPAALPLLGSGLVGLGLLRRRMAVQLSVADAGEGS